MAAAGVIAGRERWSVEQGEAPACLAALPDDCADLFLFSPPYQQARLYLENGEDLGIARDPEEWTAWMVSVFRECVRACKGLVACVCEGQTEDYRYSCTPFLLAADLCRAGFNLRKPPVYRRVGIPGSGGPDWWRNDWEPVVCVAKGGRLPWSDNTATGHPPKYPPGGKMTNRLKNGKRVHERNFKDLGKRGHTRQSYTIPDVANPGNFVDRQYAAEEVAAFLGAPADVIDCDVGGGKMGSGKAHANEAPFPEQLVEPFVRCFCPPGGLVIDPFSGSGTTGAVSFRWGRRFIGFDLRGSQVELSRRRILGETTLFDAPASPPDSPTTSEGASGCLFDHLDAPAAGREGE